MRLDKYLSDSSAYSRKELRKLIRAGAVSVNGVKVVSAEAQVGETAEIFINKKRIVYQKYLYLMLNKPQGCLSATEDKRDPVVVQLVPEKWRHFGVFPVGRLDKDTEGLLLLTNDGQFDHALMSPKKEVRKRYFAVLDRPANPSDIDAFAAGMTFSDFTAKPAGLEITTDPTRVFIEISEGKFHQVKRMCERIGKSVTFLRRVAIGPLTLDENLPVGGIRELTESERALFLD